MNKQNPETDKPFELHPDLLRDGIELGHFELCALLLINDSTFPWFVLVPQRDSIRELVELTSTDYELFWQESAQLSRALITEFSPDKLNVAALGNMTPQLHIHHIVRYANDPAWPSPIWGKFPLKPYSDSELKTMKKRIVSQDIEGLR